MKRVILVFLFLAFCAPAFAGESQLQKATHVLNERHSDQRRGAYPPGGSRPGQHVGEILSQEWTSVQLSAMVHRARMALKRGSPL
jgi:hypothetical protein